MDAAADFFTLPVGIQHQSYLMRIPGITESKRNEIIVKMAEAGVACNVHFKPLDTFGLTILTVLIPLYINYTFSAHFMHCFLLFMRK